MSKSVFAGLAVVVGLLGAVGAASGGILVTFTEQLGTQTTVVRVSGSLDTSQFPAPIAATIGFSTGCNPVETVVLGPSDYVPLTLYRFEIPFFVPFGMTRVTGGTFLGGDVFGFQKSSPNFLFLPPNYVSSAPINSHALFNHTFATMLINPAAVVMNLPGDQTITLNFVSVPTPGAAALLGLGGLLSARRRRV